MDVLLSYADNFILDDLYAQLAPNWGRDYWQRQFWSIVVIWWLGGWISYLIIATLSYIFLFDKETRKDKRFLPNQEWLEIKVSLISIPIMALPSALIFLAEVNGYSKLYDTIEGWQGWAYAAFSVLLYLVFTDTMIYWIHRWLHHPLLYAPIHKLHHKWVVSTPFAAYAFHPADGFSQSIPYHFFVFFFPLNKWLYLGLFIGVMAWTISIHDGYGIYSGSIINGSDHHTIHHAQFLFNYGQYFTFWDRVCGTHKLPPKHGNVKAA